jgi:hypothetical protein
MAASVSEAPSFEGFNFVAGRDRASGGACIFREALRMDHLDLCEINARNVLVLRGYASFSIEVCLSEPATHAKHVRKRHAKYFSRGVLPHAKWTSLAPAG